MGLNYMTERMRVFERGSETGKEEEAELLPRAVVRCVVNGVLPW